MKTLVATPWLGSLHYELVCWQGYLRSLSKHFDQTIVVCDENKKSIYSDFATRLVNKENEDIVGELCRPREDVTVVTKHDVPVDWVTHQPVVAGQTFRRIGGFHGEPNYGLLIDSPDSCHLKARDWARLTHTVDRHLGVGWVNDDLESGISVFGDDFRGCPFPQLVDLVTSSAIVIGPSGGTVVLAALCGVPFITWVDKGVVNLYKDVWNPLNTLGTAFNGLPSVDNIMEHILRINQASEKVNSHE